MPGSTTVLCGRWSSDTGYLADLPKPPEHGPGQLLWVALLELGLGLMNPEPFWNSVDKDI